MSSNIEKMFPRLRLVTAGLVLSGVLVFSLLGVVSSGASVAVGGKVSARLSKTSFTAAQAKTVKLVCKFSPASKRFGYLLSQKKGARWVKVRSVNKTGSFKGSYTMTVKKLFGSKAVKIGQYRVKVSADANSVTRTFKVVKASSQWSDARHDLLLAGSRDKRSGKHECERRLVVFVYSFQPPSRILGSHWTERYYR